jgi:5-azacytidine-induced protein 1
MHAEHEERLEAAKAASEETISRHLEFIDRLLADKAELSKQCESLTSQMRSLEERYAAGEAKREEAYAKELRKQKEVWASAEKAKREQWLADKTKEIKEATVRGLEPDIQRLVARHRDESRKIEEGLREEHRREMASERSRMQRAAQERERDVCAQRLQEMSMHFEEQLRQQRARSAAAAASELEERDEGRRREIGRLEAELSASKQREEEALSQGRVEREALRERLGREHSEKSEALRKAHAKARAEWESELEGDVAARVERAKAGLEEAASQQRKEQLGVVVNRLSGEMAASEQKWRGQLESARAQAEARIAEAQATAQGELDDLRSKYVGTVEAQTQLEARLRAVSDELAAARESERRCESEAVRLKRDVEVASLEAREAKRAASLEAGAALAQAQGERQAMSDELAQLRAEQRAMGSAHAAELADARTVKDGELSALESRLCSLSERKDETIRSLQGQVAGLQAELHTAREQLHSTQQEILAFQ